MGVYLLRNGGYTHAGWATLSTKDTLVGGKRIDPLWVLPTLLLSLGFGLVLRCTPIGFIVRRTKNTRTQSRDKRGKSFGSRISSAFLLTLSFCREGDPNPSLILSQPSAVASSLPLVQRSSTEYNKTKPTKSRRWKRQKRHATPHSRRPAHPGIIRNLPVMSSAPATCEPAEAPNANASLTSGMLKCGVEPHKFIEHHPVTKTNEEKGVNPTQRKRILRVCNQTKSDPKRHLHTHV